MNKLPYVLCTMVFVFSMSVGAFAVGELLGLTVKVVVEDEQAYEGRVIEETETTLTLSVLGQSVKIERAAIQAISLVQNSGNPSDLTIEDDPTFQEIRLNALKRVATWQLVRDAFGVSQALLLSVYASSQPSGRFDLILGYLGVGLVGVVWDFIAKPSQAEIIFWESRLPFWYGITGFVGSGAGLGGTVSLALGFVQNELALPDLGTARQWFDRAGLFYLLQAGMEATHLIYNGAVLLTPSAS